MIDTIRWLAYLPAAFGFIVVIEIVPYIFLDLFFVVRLTALFAGLVVLASLVAYFLGLLWLLVLRDC
jgi:hypothetical protein